VPPAPEAALTCWPGDGPVDGLHPTMSMAKVGAIGSNALIIGKRLGGSYRHERIAAGDARQRAGTDNPSTEGFCTTLVQHCFRGNR
jgi:hypothetical protein